MREFRRRKWFLVEGLSRDMTVVCCTEDTEVSRIVGPAQGERFDVVDLEVVGGFAFVA